MPFPWAAGLVALLVPCAVGRVEKAAKVSRLRIVNGCQREPIWVAHEAGRGIGPDPQNVKIKPLDFYDFETPGGLSGTRYWPKMRCDESGNACDIGESGGPQEVCGTQAGCAPPVDTKFEATFGHEGEEDWVDMSLVDGYTLPFRFEMKGNCSAGFGSHREGGNVVDCSHLSVKDCPGAEDLGSGRSGVSLEVVNPETSQIVGCYSPCSKLTLAQWGNPVVYDKSVTNPYCCPTPPESPEACRAGPVNSTDFVRAVHRMCPGVYGYSYDDGMGLVRCPSHTQYEVTFYCPDVPKAKHPPKTVVPMPAPTPAPAPVPTLAPAVAPVLLRPGAPKDQLTWVKMHGLPREEGVTLVVPGLVPAQVTGIEEIRKACVAQALCVGFSFRPKTGEWYLKRMGTGFDGGTAAWLRYKWGHEEWQYHYLPVRASAGPIRWAPVPAKCLGVAGAGASSEVQLQDCVAGSGPQQFQADTSGAIHWAVQPSLCLEVAGGVPINGNRLRVMPCRNGDALGAFEFPASGLGKIRWGAHRGMCLDVKDGKALSGTPIQIWGCSDGDNAQDFTPAFSIVSKGALGGAASHGGAASRGGAASHGNAASRGKAASRGGAAGHQHQVAVEGRQIRWALRPWKCLTPVEGSGTFLRLEDCGGSSMQKQKFVWDGVEGKIQSAEHVDLCIDIFNLAPHVRLANCSTSKTKLQFKDLELGAGGKIRWAEFPIFCLDATEGKDLHLSACKDGDSKQDFTTLESGKSHHGQAHGNSREHESSVHIQPWGQDLLGSVAAAAISTTEPPQPEVQTSQLRGPGDRHATPSAGRRLLVRNGCGSGDLWIASKPSALAPSTSEPEAQSVKLRPLESHSFATLNGTAGTKFWPKMGCDANGQSCSIGEYRVGDAGCGPQGCTLVDTTFEAIFGTNGGDLAFVSLEKGYTLPFKLEVKGDCNQGSSPTHTIDCSGLSLDRCPIAEDLSSVGSRVDLRLWNARREVVGCFSPCSRVKHVHGSDEKSLTHEFCCPAGTSAKSCRAGSSDYVEALHQMCPGAASYASDGGSGVLRCHDTTQYELTFYCPAHGATQQHGHDLVEMLISKTSQQQGGALHWRWRSWWLAGIAAAVSASAALVTAVRVGARARTAWERRRGRILWQPLATPPGV